MQSFPLYQMKISGDIHARGSSVSSVLVTGSHQTTDRFSPRICPVWICWRKEESLVPSGN